MPTELLELNDCRAITVLQLYYFDFKSGLFELRNFCKGLHKFLWHQIIMNGSKIYKQY